MTSPPAILCDNLCKQIDDRPILNSINLSISPGDFVALLGANGAGKTTLLNILATLTSPSRGEFRLFGLTPAQGKSVLRSRIGLLGHQPMLYRDLSARENLVFFARLYLLDNFAARADELLELMGLADRAGDPVAAFSRGMTQRLSIARALLHNPELLLADEPFAGLDVPSTQSIERLFARLNQAGKTILIVNHDIPQSLRLAKRVVVLRDGGVALDCPVTQVDAAGIEAALIPGAGG